MRSPAARGVLAVLGALHFLTLASPAKAAGINLYWDDCGVAGSTNKVFACDTNTGFHDMYASFDPPATLPVVNGTNVFIDLQAGSATLPDWWQFKNPGSCRQTSLQGPDSGPGSCVDTWQGMGAPGIVAYRVTANTPSMPPNRARIIGSLAVPGATVIRVDPGHEYFAMLFRITNAKTVGAGLCSGCDVPVCIVLNSIIVTQPPLTPPGSPEIINPITSNFVTWQGGAIGGAGCPGATPTLNRTWGALKSLYR